MQEMKTRNVEMKNGKCRIENVEMQQKLQELQQQKIGKAATTTIGKRNFSGTL